jgi:hypothetical protein
MFHGGCEINSMVSWISNIMIANCDFLADRNFSVFFILTATIPNK